MKPGVGGLRSRPVLYPLGVPSSGQTAKPHSDFEKGGLPYPLHTESPHKSHTGLHEVRGLWVPCPVQHGFLHISLLAASLPRPPEPNACLGVSAVLPVMGHNEELSYLSKERL